MIQGFVQAATVYLILGAAFALPFLWRGAGRIDPAAARGTLSFRLVIMPGVVALWPLLLWRWWHASRTDA